MSVDPTLLVAGTAIMLASGLAGAVAILDVDFATGVRRRRLSPLLQRERVLAASLNLDWRKWVFLRLTVILGALVAGVLLGIWALTLLLVTVAVLGLPFLLAGRGAAARLRMERAFLEQLRELRDRMAIGNQSLDAALQEIGRQPPAHLQHVLAPLGGPGSMVDNIVSCAERSPSPIIEQALTVLIWARSRSLDALIETVDQVVLPVGEAQLALQEEAMVTMAQQRAVTFAMAGLMTVMFVAAIRVETFRSFYQSGAGLVVLGVVTALFFGLIALLGRIMGSKDWTRWDVRGAAAIEARRDA